MVQFNISYVSGNILDQTDCDAIINSANSSLRAGSGVCGVIHKAAGPELAIYGQRFAPLRPGEAILTPGFNLPIPYVIHVCAPKYPIDHDAERLLGLCLWRGIKLAEENHFKRIALPAVGAGINGFTPTHARAIFQEVAETFSASPALKEIRYVTYQTKTAPEGAVSEIL